MRSKNVLIIMLSYLFSGVNFLISSFYLKAADIVLSRYAIALAAIMLMMAVVSVLDPRKENRGIFAAICTCIIFFAFCIALACVVSTSFIVICPCEITFCAIIVYVSKKTGDSSPS